VRHALVEAVRPQSLIVLPLGSTERRFGRMLLCTTARTWRADDLTLAEELASRVSMALARSFLFEDLQRALRIRDDALAMIAHDLRQTLYAIRMQLHLVKGPDSPTLSSARHYLDVMLRFVDGLLDLGQIEAETLTIRSTLEDVRELAEEAAQLVQPEARPTIVVEVPDGARLKCDRPRILQVLFNLLSNAAKFAPDSREIRLRVEYEREWIQLSIIDGGPGIAPEDLPHLFERYWRAHADRFPGFGLGLYMIKKIVEAHGGQLSVESKLGHGSTFRVRLPLTVESA
jgi:signal transduction histidine kinase